MKFRGTVLSLVVMLAAHQAHGQQVTPPEANVFDQAVGQIRTSLEQDCVPYIQDVLEGAVSKQLGLGLQPFDKPLATLDETQSVNLLQYIQSQLRTSLQGQRRIGFRDTFMLEKLQPAVRTRTLDNTHLLIRTDVLATADKREFQLVTQAAEKFQSKIGFECEASSPTYKVPPEIIGDRIYTLDELLKKFAVRTYQQVQTNHHRMMVTIPDQNLESVKTEAVSLITRELDYLRSSYRVIGGDKPVVEISEKSFDPSLLERDVVGWDIRISGSPQPRETLRVSITGNVTNGQNAFNPVAETGLVLQSSLPVRALAQTRADQMQRERLASWKVAGVKPFALKDSVTRVGDTPDYEGTGYTFQLASDRVVELDFEQNAMRPLSLLDLAGREIAPAFVGNAQRPNLRRYTLSQGQYVLRVAGKDPFVLRARSAERILEPEPPGRLTRTFGDWDVGMTNAGGQRVCYAFSTATDRSRLSRLQKPVAWFSTTDVKNAPLLHYLDFTQFYKPGKSMVASIWSRSRMLNEIRVSDFEGRVTPVQKGPSGGNVLSLESIRGFTQGTSLRVQGAGTQGEPSEVVYSLVGYTQAMNAMAMACGRPELAQSLVW